ncbi:helix-turn-helix domain-containing protein [Lederbergia wuyishanensis]|uniref:YesN/AraC family two-component response regulator n=1 Tax=Lederbergia wuyishanensis TaxID=1347903 RepID=A0ABU0D985_9BACI|nr:helix-turn-helix domain-containing protein [Lederbergia wuyishanensis]MCJ8009417.1 helix-turn-helix domain-containing protein [Lederbergia wuyishanensis]MDQ0344974.1 YesN/AraC family two-component response regulator [Lederbergia wuyishanensis]
MRLKVPSRLQLKYILSYMFIFLIPFSIMAFIFYQNSVNSLRKEIELTNINNLNNIKTLTDNRMKELTKIGALISYNPQLTPYMIGKSEFQAEAISELTKYKENSSIITEIYLYYYNQNSIYSSNGLMSLEAFLQHRSHLKDMDQKKFTQQMMEFEYPGIAVNQNIFPKNPTYMFPLSPNLISSYGIVLFRLNDSFFRDMIKNTLGSFEGKVFIFNEKNEIVASYSNKDSSFNESKIKKILNSDSNITEITIDRVNYSISKVKSETSKWSFVTVIPTNEFFSKVSEFKSFILLVLFFIITITSLISIYIALKQYHPIKKLIEFAKGNDNSYQAVSRNELDNLQKSMEMVYANHEYLNEKFAKQEPLVRDQCLIMLLQGQMNAVEHSKELFRSFNLDFNDPYSFVIVTSFSKSQLSEINTKEVEQISNEILNDAKIYSVEIINDNTMVFIVNGKYNNTFEKQQFLLEFEKSLTDQQTIVIGVGSTYKGKEHINRSFIEASAALESGKLNEQSGIIFFSDIKKSPESLWLPKDHLLKLIQSYKQGNAEIAIESINSLVAWVKCNNSSSLFIKHMKYDIINNIIKTITDMDIDFNPEKLFYLSDINSLDEFEAKLSQFTNEICIEINKIKEKQANQLQLNILNYIKEHFDQYDLSLENLAHEFNLSASYLSRFIKEETNITFSQYVWELRLEEVKKQLIQTNMPVKNIINQVGYIDVPNFTRKFKGAVGITPGQYRKLYSN